MINGFDRIVALQLGISDSEGKLPLYCNDSGNRGGDSFASFASNRRRSIVVPVKTLDAIFVEYGIEKINVMKIDIEGLEFKALSRFLSIAPEQVWPSYICVEVTHSPEAKSLL